MRGVDQRHWSFNLEWLSIWLSCPKWCPMQLKVMIQHFRLREFLDCRHNWFCSCMHCQDLTQCLAYDSREECVSLCFQFCLHLNYPLFSSQSFLSKCGSKPVSYLHTEIKKGALSFYWEHQLFGESQSRPARPCPSMELEAEDQGH